MHSKKARAADASPGSREMAVAKTPQQQNATTQGETNDPKTESKWAEDVLAKWRGALVKARLALHKKREKKKEKHVKYTLARLRKIADAAREQDDDGAPERPPPLKKKKNNSLAPSLSKQSKGSSLSQQAKAQVSAALAAESASPRIPKKARTPSEAPQPHDGPLDKKIISIARVRKQEPKGRTTSASRSDLDESDWQKRERRKDQVQEPTDGSIGASTAGEVEDAAQVEFSFKRPSVEELRDFAKNAR